MIIFYLFIVDNKYKFYNEKNYIMLAQTSGVC